MSILQQARARTAAPREHLQGCTAQAPRQRAPQAGAACAGSRHVALLQIMVMPTSASGVNANISAARPPRRPWTQT